MTSSPTFVGADDSEYFRQVYDRTLNSLNNIYLLPADKDEVKRAELQHRMFQFVFGGRNYVGPVKEALQFGRKRRILDLGTGGGTWAIDMADEFPRAEVIGIDLAPVQPRSVPPNCTFELYDLDAAPVSLPFPDSHFDLIHARCLHTGIRDYPQLLREIARTLAPQGMVLLIEPDLNPLADGHGSEHFPEGVGAPGWFNLWDTYRRCLTRLGIDVTVPQHLQEMLSAIPHFENVTKRDGSLPIGFWSEDETSLTVGQLQWMAAELFLPALKPLFYSVGIPKTQIDSLVANAQQDLYHPMVKLSTHMHVVHASKRS